jgi:hypothetical protein
MDTNPEEFEDDFALGGGKWYDIVQAVHARKNAPEAHRKDAQEVRKKIQKATPR